MVIQKTTKSTILSYTQHNYKIVLQVHFIVPIPWVSHTVCITKQPITMVMVKCYTHRDISSYCW